MKYLICVLIERLHRFVFDVIYVQDRTARRYDQLFIKLLNACAWCVPDYRQRLRQTGKRKYLRYTKYEDEN